MPLNPDALVEAATVTAHRVWWMFTNPLFWLLPVAGILLARRSAKEHDAAERERIAERIRNR